MTELALNFQKTPLKWDEKLKHKYLLNGLMKFHNSNANKFLLVQRYNLNNKIFEN